MAPTTSPYKSLAPGNSTQPSWITKRKKRCSQNNNWKPSLDLIPYPTKNVTSAKQGSFHHDPSNFYHVEDVLQEESVTTSGKFDPTPITYSQENNLLHVSEGNHIRNRRRIIKAQWDTSQLSPEAKPKQLLHEEDYGFDKEHSPIPSQIVQTSIQILRILSTRTTRGAKFLAFTRNNHLHL